MSRRKRQTIPVPRPDLASLTETLMAVKQHIEHTTNDDENAYVSLRDLLSLGIVIVNENGSQRQLVRSDIAKIRLVDRNSDPA
jgi:hypothetical protein